MWALFMASSTDPGIIPKQEHSEYSDSGRYFF